MMKSPRVGDKVIRIGKSTETMRYGECHTIKRIQQDRMGRDWIVVGQLVTRAEVFWNYFKPVRIKLENK